MGQLHIGLRLHLRRMLRSGEYAADKAAAIRQVLADDDMLAALAAYAAQSNPGLLGADPSQTPILDWLKEVGKWLWDHREEIMAFIMEIIKLFGG